MTPDESTPPRELPTFVVVGGMAVLIVVGLLGLAVFGLGGRTLLDFDYQGVDNK